MLPISGPANSGGLANFDSLLQRRDEGTPPTHQRRQSINQRGTDFPWVFPDRGDRRRSLLSELNGLTGDNSHVNPGLEIKAL